MKTLKYIPFVCALLIAFSSCKKTDDEIQPSLSINPAVKSIESNQGSFKVAVTSTVKWTANSDMSWLTVDPISGTGDGTVQVNYEFNTSATARTALITFQGANVEDKVLTITQTGVSPFLSVTPPNQNVGAGTGNTSFTVSSNTNWIVACDKLWCTLSQYSGMGNAELVATFLENTLPTQRIATLSFQVTGLDILPVTVTQAAFIPSLFVSPSNQNVSSVAGSTSFNVAANIAWTAESDTNWCTINTSGTGNGTINANFTENTSSVERVAHITVKGDGVTEQIATVTQQAAIPTEGLVAYYPFNGNANDESGNGNNGSVHGSSIAFPNGKKSSCVEFNNSNFTIAEQVNDYIKLPNTNFGNTFTICYWLDYRSNPFPQGGSSCCYSFGYDNAFGYNHTHLISWITSSKGLVIDFGAENGNIGTNPFYITPNVWYFVTIVLSSSKLELYVDGILNQTINFSFTYNADNLEQFISLQQWFSQGTTQSSSRFNGKVDQLRIYNRILTINEIQALYNE